MAKTYEEVAVEKWNVKHFHQYLAALHEKRFGIAYQPGGTWQREVGLLGDIIGTQKKPAKYDKALIKEFIARCIETHVPNPSYPGMNFMFMWGYRKNVLQQLELEFNRKNAAEKAQDDDLSELEDWL